MSTPLSTFDYDASGAALAARPRVALPGPESDLIDAFLARVNFRASRNLRVTLFREPKLQSGFPDLVFVTWHAPTAAKWREERARLRTDDLRLMQLLLTNGPTPTDRLRYLFGPTLQTCIARLIEAGLISRQRSRWRVAPLSSAFAVRRIVALEAKVAKYAEALDQAERNRWFATESYVLLPRMPLRSSILKDARDRGVGIWISGHASPMVPAEPSAFRQPLSIPSWMFNEWAWRDARRTTSEASHSTKETTGESDN